MGPASYGGGGAVNIDAGIVRAAKPTLRAISSKVNSLCDSEIAANQ